MKKIFALVIASVFCIAFISSCVKKKGDKNAITPDYSATGNPNPNVQTVTGANTYSNPATVNSSILIGTSGWSNLTCASTNSATLKGSSGNTEVTVTFAGAVTTGTYAISTVPSAGVSCAMTIINPPNQPAGIVWYGKSGVVTVSQNANAINAVFVNVVCTQQTFNFPTVAASGTVSCN